MTSDQAPTNERLLDDVIEDSFPASDPPSYTPGTALGPPAHSVLQRRRSNPAFGFALSSEEVPPTRLVRLAKQAEDAGLDFVSISDHFHPWLPAQGNSPFVWSVLGGIAQATDRIVVGTGVTCPILRMHPAIVAHAVGTVAEMLPDRFFLGLGTGESLNEHVTGERWPSAQERLERLEEAIGIIRGLLSGDELTYDGAYFSVFEARLFTRPNQVPPILLASSSPGSARMAGGEDGLITTSPDPDVFRAFEEAGGREKPRLGQITVCWDETEAAARAMARRNWANSVLSWELRLRTPTPALFEEITERVTEDEVAEGIVCGPQVEPIVARTREYLEAGFDHIYFHQVGTRQEDFLEFYRTTLLPGLRSLAAVPS
jgi:coenzyme F420-dependent glucose-6-phosphate dehydrogenase